jgi:CRP-like cAMP-binding protein
VTAVLTRLNIEVFLKDEIIIQADTKGDRMYFIARGKVAIITNSDSIMDTLEAGSYFGEICLLTDERRSATVKALTPCDLCTLKKRDFLELMEEYPDVESMFQSVALARLSMIGKNRSSITFPSKIRTDRTKSITSLP